MTHFHCGPLIKAKRGWNRKLGNLQQKNRFKKKQKRKYLKTFTPKWGKDYTQ